jgi:hypothetical protein
MAMECVRCRPSVPMYRFKNDHGTAIGKCNRCCKDVECAYCLKCGNKLCVPCYNKTVSGAGKQKPSERAPFTDEFTL